jgi:hypothetical protein
MHPLGSRLSCGRRVRFFWSLHGVVLTRPPSIHTDGTPANREGAKAQFQKSWDARKAWAKLEEVP